MTREDKSGGTMNPFTLDTEQFRNVAYGSNYSITRFYSGESVEKRGLGSLYLNQRGNGKYFCGYYSTPNIMSPLSRTKRRAESIEDAIADAANDLIEYHQQMIVALESLKIRRTPTSD